MEVRIWMEDVQRIVGGVVEQTTCRDVVVALAQTVGRTGRYILVERWRGGERRLSPTESLVRALQKRGEHASEVELILKHSTGQRSHRHQRITAHQTDHRITNGTDSGVTSSESAGICHESTEVRVDNGPTNLLKYRTFGGMEHLHLIGHGLANGDVTNGNGRSASGHVISLRQGSRDLANGHSLESSEQSSVASRSSVSLSPQASLDLGTAGAMLGVDTHQTSQGVHLTPHQINFTSKSVTAVNNHHFVNSKFSNSNSKSGEQAYKLSRTVESVEESVDEISRELFTVTNNEKYVRNSTPVDIEVHESNRIENGSCKSSSSSTNFSPMSSISSEVSSGSSRQVDTSRTTILSKLGKPTERCLATNAMETAAHSLSPGTQHQPTSDSTVTSSSDLTFHATKSSDRNAIYSALDERNKKAMSSKSSNSSSSSYSKNNEVINNNVSENHVKLVSSSKTNDQISTKPRHGNESGFARVSTQSHEYESHEPGRHVSKRDNVNLDNVTTSITSQRENISATNIGLHSGVQIGSTEGNSQSSYTNNVDNSVAQRHSNKNSSQTTNHSKESSDMNTDESKQIISSGNSVKELRTLFSAAADSHSTNALHSGLDRRELLETVRQQNDVIVRQLQQLEELQTEICSVQESQGLSGTENEADEAELKGLAEREGIIDGELTELELVSWEDKLDMEQQKEKQMTTELSLLKSNITRSEKEIERLEAVRKELEKELDVSAPSGGRYGKGGNLTQRGTEDADDLRIQLAELKLKNSSAVKQLSDVTVETDSAKLDTEERRSKIAKLNTEILQADQHLFKLLQGNDSGRDSDRVNV